MLVNIVGTHSNLISSFNAKRHKIMAMTLFDHKPSIMPDSIAVTGGRIIAYGEAAVVLELNKSNNMVQQRKLWLLKSTLDQHKQNTQSPHKPVFLDVVLGNNNITVIFNSLQYDFSTIVQSLQSLWEDCCAPNTMDSAGIAGSKKHILKANFGNEFGADLRDAASHSSLSANAFIERYCEQEYIVMFLGFQPGFAYLSGLPELLHVDRKTDPRLTVAEGSIAIGGSQTGIYPSASPGGWQIIGRIDSAHLPLFDLNRDQPSTFYPGDTICFVPQNVVED